MEKKQQRIAIFTTASLPWMTGTSVNPLFRAMYLAKQDEERKVTLVIPWLSLKDQEHVYPDKITFNLPSEQEKYVRNWVEERTGFRSCFDIRFYPGKFSRDKKSILGVGDITEVIPDEDADVAVLEEPEHLTWYHHGRRWKTKFRLVVGVVHTNYLEYVKREKNGRMTAFFLKYINSWVVNIYCHKVIRLSAATQDFPRSIICNVHGVNPRFIEIGKKKNEQQQAGNKAFDKGAYYIGKMIWHKGYKELLKLLRDNQNDLTGLEVDLYGNGEDSAEVEEAAKKLELTVRVHPGRDHADPLFHDYKVLLNPSTTDVVCTTSAEALAMGKIVVCADHPSNDFFRQFPNCRTYNGSKGFVEATRKALAEEPSPLTDAQRHELSWEAATERFLRVAELDQAPLPKAEVEQAPTPKRLTKSSSKLFMSTSINLGRRMEDASALAHFAVTALLSSKPDEDQRKKLGLAPPSRKC